MSKKSKFPIVTDRSAQPIFYRVHGTKVHSTVELTVEKFYGIKETDQGWWCLTADDRQVLGMYVFDKDDSLAEIKKEANPVFILKNGSSKLAKPTLEEAMDAYRGRKYWHEVFSKERYVNAKTQKDVANRITGEHFEKLKMLGKVAIDLKPEEWSPSDDLF